MKSKGELYFEILLNDPFVSTHRLQDFHMLWKP